MGFSTMNLCVLFLLLCLLAFSSSSFGGSTHIMTYTRYKVSATKLEPYDWSYIRVELPPPPFYASASIEIASDVKLNLKKIVKHPKRKLPIICFRGSGPPLPDVSETALEVLDHLSNGSSGEIQNLHNIEQCYPLQKNMTFKLMSQQITPGVYYIGLFNGIGSTRTQSKMINRGSTYSFSANLIVEGCLNSTMWGEHCDQVVDDLSNVQHDSNEFGNRDDEHCVGNIACTHYSRVICTKNMDMNVYFLDVMEAVERLTIRFNKASHFHSRNANVSSVMLYARHNAIPDKILHDYSTDITKDPLVVHLPMAGIWYFAVKTVFWSNVHEGMRERNTKLCYLVEWETIACQQGKAGPNCTWEGHILKAIPKQNPNVVLVYLPDSETVSSNSTYFSLDPFLSKSAYGDRSDYAWTYFLLHSTIDTEGNNLNIQLRTDTKLSYELYVRFGGLPSLNVWDYSYLNQRSSCNSSSMFKLYATSQETINLYILYPKTGLWTIGLRHPVAINNSLSTQTTMFISSKSCPNRCSDHGECVYSEDATQSTYYSYCTCDRNHGGFDCSVSVVSATVQRWHEISLIASNAAALLPAFKVLQKKACAEWVIFMASGISSALYHACDVGCWCALPFHVLQFMDFWLSFLAVVSTFIYLTTISETAKRTIHTLAAIITALLAISGATRSINIVIVLAIGALAFLVGWLIQFCTRYRTFSFPSGSSLKILERWQTFEVQFLDIMKTIYRHFRWGFVFLGFIAMSMAALSRSMENSQNYWIWHSTWHISIYTSAFFFVCSKVNIQNADNQEAPATTSYEPTQQGSLP